VGAEVTEVGWRVRFTAPITDFPREPSASAMSVCLVRRLDGEAARCTGWGAQSRSNTALTSYPLDLKPGLSLHDA
jgi:hypothetical protein